MAGIKNDVLVGKNADFSQAGAPNSTSSENNGLVTDGKMWIGSTVVNAGGTHINVGSITSPNGSLTLGYSSPNITAQVTNDLHVAKWIVNPVGNVGGNQLTVQAAIDAAVSGETIFIYPGTYTENLTLKAGVNLTAFGCDSSLNGTGKVIISGTCTFTAAGSVTISGIQLQTNSAALLAVTGTLASVVNLQNCYLNCTNNTGITYSTSSASSAINIYSCSGNLGTTGIALFSHSSAGNLNISYSGFSNTGGSSTASTVSAGMLGMSFSIASNPITTSGTGGFVSVNGNYSTSAQNVTCLTVGGSGSHSVANSNFNSGTASCISISTSLGMNLCVVNSSNANAITGAGTIINGGVSFSGSSSKINTTTQTANNFDVGGISFDGGTNIISNYTVGTFTPTMTGSAVAGTTTYTAQNGYYVRIGATAQIQAVITGTAATGTGNVVFGGFPFTIKNQTNGNVYGSFSHANSASFPWAANTTDITVLGNINTTNGSLVSCGTTTNQTGVPIANATFNMQYSMVHQI